LLRLPVIVSVSMWTARTFSGSSPLFETNTENKADQRAPTFTVLDRGTACQEPP